MDFMRDCFPHLGYVDAVDVDIRIQGRHGVVVAEIDGEPVGFAVWYETVPGIAYIWLTGVAEGFRGKGIGSALLRTVVNNVRELGMRAVWCKISKEKVGWIRKHIQMGFRVAEHVREDGHDIYKVVKTFGEGTFFIL